MNRSSSWMLATICVAATFAVSSPAAAANDSDFSGVGISPITLPGQDTTNDRGVERPPARHYDARAYEGVYGRVDVLGAAFGMKSPSACETAGCDADGTYGAFIGLRLGYSFGWLGVEAGGTVLGDLQLATGSPPASGGGASRNAELVNAARTPHYLHYGVGGLIGVGPRFTTKGHSLRFSLGVLPGVAIRNLGVRRQTGPDAAVATTTEASFGMTADAGVLLGATPGFRVYLGVMAWADFADHSGTTVARDDGLPKHPAVATGQQVYVGPVLGFGFGH